MVLAQAESERILRPLTMDERQEMEDLLEKQESGLTKEIVDQEVAHKAQKTPFCAVCARTDIQDKLAVLTCDTRADLTGITRKDLGWSPNWKDYSDRMRFIATKKCVAPVLVGTSKVQQVVGWDYVYSCRVRGHGFTIHVPVGDKGPDGKRSTTEGMIS